MQASKRKARQSWLLAMLLLIAPGVYAGLGSLSDVERLMREAEELWSQGRSDQALQKFGQALTRVREIGERGREWQILDRIGRVYLEREEFPQALDHFQQGLKVALDLGDRSAQAVQLAASVRPTTCSSSRNRPLPPMSHCWRWRRSARTWWGSGAPITALAFRTRRMMRQPKQCRTCNEPWSWPAHSGTKALSSRHCRSSKPITQGWAIMPRWPGIAKRSSNSGRPLAILSSPQRSWLPSGYAYEQIGSLQSAARQYQAALERYRDLGDARGTWRALDDLGRLALKQQNATGAVERYQDALQLARQAGYREGQVLALEHAAAAYRSTKDYAKATQTYQEALKAAREAKLREYEWLVLSDLGSLYAEYGEPQSGCLSLPTGAHSGTPVGR